MSKSAKQTVTLPIPPTQKHTARYWCDAIAPGCWLKIKSKRNDTHFFTEGQSGDDIAGCHCEVFREINRAALVAHQNLSGKTSWALSVCVVTLEKPNVCLLEEFPVFFTFLRWRACLSITLCKDCWQQRCRAPWTRRRCALHSSV